VNLAIKAVLSDLDGTLYTSDKFEFEVRKKTSEIVAEKLGITQSEAKKIIREAKKACITLTRSLDHIGVSRHIFYEELSRTLNYSKFLKPDPRIKDLIDKTHELGCKFAVITNSGRPHALKTMNFLNIPISSLDALVTSSEVEPKVSPEPYLRALDLLRVKVNEAIYIGDRTISEVKPAKELGIYTVLVSKKKGKSPWADWVIRSPFKLIDLLRMFKKT
jgi:FMN phosphatase YigB (HAD superfamily)